jgi:hypothetical protein
VALTSEQRTTLQSWVTAGKTEQRLALRAQIILALDEGLEQPGGGGAAGNPSGDGQQMAWPVCTA